MSSGPHLLIAIATLNEIETLPPLVQSIWEYLPAADILVVDDNSADGTGRWCAQQRAVEPRLQCLHRPGRLGLGSATLLALQHAIDKEYALVATIDADLSHDPRVLAEMYARMSGAGGQSVDCLIGSRYVAGGRIENWPWYRRLASRGINAMARIWLRLRTRDNSSALRMYRTEALRRIELCAVRSTGYAYLEEILWILSRSGAKFEETPMTFRDRPLGKSKMSLWEALKTIADLIRVRLRHR